MRFFLRSTISPLTQSVPGGAALYASKRAFAAKLHHHAEKASRKANEKKLICVDPARKMRQLRFPIIDGGIGGRRQGALFERSAPKTFLSETAENADKISMRQKICVVILVVPFAFT